MIKKFNSMKKMFIVFLLAMSVVMFSGAMFLSTASAVDGDVTEVKLTVDFSPYEDKFPVGVVGKTYTIFNSSAVDNLGNKVQVQVTVYAPDGTVVPLLGNKFKTETVGVYTMEYSAEKGTVHDIERVDIKVEATCEPLEYEFSDKIKPTGTTGEMYYLYDGEIFGGSGIVESDLVVMLGETIVKDYDAGDCSYFIPTKSGEYELVCKLKDFVGNEYSEIMILSIEDSLSPIMEEPSVAKVNMIGDTIKLPLVDAIIYNEGDVCFVPVKVYYDDTEITDSMTYEVTEKGVHTVKYVSVNPNMPEHETIRSFNVAVVDPADNEIYVSNYLAIENAVGSYPDYADGYLMTVIDDGRAGFQFKSKIYEEFLSVEFGVYNVHQSQTDENGEVIGKLELTKRTFEGIELTFIDSKAGKDKVTIQIYEENNSMVVYNRGKLCYKSNSNLMDELSDGMYVRYDYTKGCLVDNLDNVLLDIKYFNDGREFTGFNSDYAYLECNLIGADSQTILCVKGIANDSISNATSDRMKPKFYLSQEIPGSISADIGETVLLECPEAFDLFSEKVTYSIKITNQTTKADVFEGKIDGAYELKITEYGEYKVEFYAKDNRNQQRRIMTVRVVDRISPNVEVSEMKATAKVGEEITLPKMVINDNCTLAEDCISYVYVSYGNFLKYMVYETYVFEEEGEHVFTFTVWDAQSNCTTVKYTVMVTK